MPRLLLLLPLVLLGCGRGEPAVGPAGSGEASAATPETAVLRGVQMGDRACYLTLEADGRETEVMAEFVLCEAGALVGQRVRLTYAPIAVAAASCEGDPACTETEEVPVATSMEAAE